MAGRRTRLCPPRRLPPRRPPQVLTGGVWRSPIVSFMWVGSALLFTTAAGDVWSLTAKGAARRLAALEPWMCDAVLMAATPDSLVYAASARDTGRVQVRGVGVAG